MAKARWITSLIAMVSVGLTLGTSASRAGQGKRFLQLRFDAESTVTFDLATVQILQPGRFTIIATTMDDPDVMRFKLRALNAADTFCGLSVGKYPMPKTLFTLGPPNMPVQDIVVGKNMQNAKYVQWSYPYLRLAFNAHSENEGILLCGRSSEYMQNRELILNGLQDKELFDCERGLTGTFLDQNEDPTKAMTYVVRAGTIGARIYNSVCRAVTHTEPYDPNK